MFYIELLADPIKGIKVDVNDLINTFNLSDYSSLNDFNNDVDEWLQELADKYDVNIDDSTYTINDYDKDVIPEKFINNNKISEELFDVIPLYAKYGTDLIEAYYQVFGNYTMTCSDVDEAYIGSFDDVIEFAENYFSDLLPDDMPSNIVIDWEATANYNSDAWIECDGYYFRNI